MKNKEQSILEAAEKHYPYRELCGTSDAIYNQVMGNKRIDYVEGAKSQAAKEWHAPVPIDAIENPPEQSGEYLGLVKSYDSYTWFIVFWRNDRRTYEVYGLGRREPVTDMNVVKWLPLPDLSEYYPIELPTINKEDND